MKTLPEIKNEVAQHYSKRSWDEMNAYDFEYGVGASKIYTSEELMDIVAKQYAAQALKEAAERVTMIVERDDEVITKKQLGWIAEDGDCIEINKESILNLIKELK